MTAAVVVKACFDSKTLEKKDGWRYSKGDLGILHWKAHRRHPRFLEPSVVWDGDPKGRIRRVILSSIAVAGVQTADTRVLVVPRAE